MYKWLLSDANAKHLGLLHAPRIILAGDSAGANLCCALMIRVTSSFSFPLFPSSPLPFSLLSLSLPSPLSSSPSLFPLLSSFFPPLPSLFSPLTTSPLLLLFPSPLLSLPSFHFSPLSSPFPSLSLSTYPSPSFFSLPSFFLSPFHFSSRYSSAFLPLSFSLSSLSQPAFLPLPSSLSFSMLLPLSTFLLSCVFLSLRSLCSGVPILFYD